MIDAAVKEGLYRKAIASTLEEEDSDGKQLIKRVIFALPLP